MGCGNILAMNNKKLRGAIIGYGFIAENGHVPAYLKRAQESGDIEIIAVADICPVRRKLGQEALPQAKTYTDYAALLDAEAQHLDFVDIATPPCDHARVAHAALSAGLQVLCEKPLTPTVQEAHSLLAHARNAHRVIFPCHNYKHAPIIGAIRDLIQRGRIGKVRSIKFETYRNTHAKGVREWNSHWRRESRYSGGGIAMDHGSHIFYLAFDWLGSYPTSVSATMSNLDSGKYDTEDDFTAVLSFPTGSAYVHLTWTAGVRKVIYTVEGEKGAITMEDDELQIQTLNGAQPDGAAHTIVQPHLEKKTISSHWGDASHAGWFNSLFSEFRKAIETDDFAGKDAQEAALCVELINTAYRSAQNGSRELPLD